MKGLSAASGRRTSENPSAEALLIHPVKTIHPDSCKLLSPHTPHKTMNLSLWHASHQESPNGAMRSVTGSAMVYSVGSIFVHICPYKRADVKSVVLCISKRPRVLIAV